MRVLRQLHQDESGQDIFEYVLIIGGVTLALMFGAALTIPGLFSAVSSGVCDAIEGLPLLECTIS